MYNSILEAKVKTKMEKYPDLSKAEATESVEEDIQKAIRYKLVEAYRKEGMNAKEIKSKIRKSATTYFKDIYINGTPEDRTRVKNKMVALGVYDSNNEVLRICSNWFNNYCKQGSLHKSLHEKRETIARQWFLIFFIRVRVLLLYQWCILWLSQKYQTVFQNNKPKTNILRKSLHKIFGYQQKF